MDSNPTVVLPPELVERAERWAQQVVDDYAAGRNAASRAVTCFDAHSNVRLQAHAKMAECAFALFAGTDPKFSITWNRHCDGGSDFFWRGKRWDIKATSARGQYLIWPIAKNHIYASKHFDMLALVRGDVPRFEIAGFVSKEEFFAHKQVSPGPPQHPLFAGTWHMHVSNLWGPQLLRGFGEAAE